MLIVRRSKLCYTASGIITLLGGRPVHRSLKYYLHSLMPASKFNKYNIFYHSNIESYTHTVMYPIYLVLSHSGDFSRVNPHCQKIIWYSRLYVLC